MRHVIKPHRELGDINITGIDLGRKCRDDMPALLAGLQHLYCDRELSETVKEWKNQLLELFFTITEYESI